MNQENEFVLPEKWCVSHSDQALEWIKINAEENGEYIEENNYYCFPRLDRNKCNFSQSIPIGYQLLTNQQFKEHVLKEIAKPEYDPKDVAFNQRSVIGYKLIKPEYWEAVSIIAGFILDDVEAKKKNKNFVIDFMKSDTAGYSSNLEKAGVLSLWFEPVYDTSITLKSGVKLSEDDIAEVKEILNNK